MGVPSSEWILGTPTTSKFGTPSCDSWKKQKEVEEE